MATLGNFRTQLELIPHPHIVADESCVIHQPPCDLKITGRLPWVGLGPSYHPLQRQDFEFSLRPCGDESWMIQFFCHQGPCCDDFISNSGSPVAPQKLKISPKASSSLQFQQDLALRVLFLGVLFRRIFIASLPDHIYKTGFCNSRLLIE